MLFSLEVRAIFCSLPNGTTGCSAVSNNRLLGEDLAISHSVTNTILFRSNIEINVTKLEMHIRDLYLFKTSVNPLNEPGVSLWRAIFVYSSSADFDKVIVGKMKLIQ